MDTPLKGLHPVVIHPCQHNLPLTDNLELNLSYLANHVENIFVDHIVGIENVDHYKVILLSIADFIFLLERR